MEKDTLHHRQGEPVRLAFVLGGKAATCIAKKMAEVMQAVFARLGNLPELKQVDFSMVISQKLRVNKSKKVDKLDLSVYEYKASK